MALPYWHPGANPPGYTGDYGVVYLEAEAGHEDEGSHEHDGRAFTHTAVTVLIDLDGMVRKEYYGTFAPETEMIGDITSLLSRP